MAAPTTTAPTITATESAPFRIAAAFITFATSVLADLNTLFGTSEGAGNAFTARAVVSLLSGAYTGSGTGTLTASANAAFGTQDGVSTLAVGDVVLLQAGTTNLTAAKDAGPYTISVLGSGTVKWVLTRPLWWATGATAPLSQRIEIGGSMIPQANTMRADTARTSAMAAAFWGPTGSGTSSSGFLSVDRHAITFVNTRLAQPSRLANLTHLVSVGSVRVSVAVLGLWSTNDIVRPGPNIGSKHRPNAYR